MNAETLFTTTEKNLEKFIGLLTEDEIQDSCTSTIYYRGKEYYENNLATSVVLTEAKTLLNGKVRGNKTYAVQIRLKERKVYASCTCPYDGEVCKHVVAVLLYAVNEEIKIDTAVPGNSDTNIKSYLDSLSREKLIDLVINYAPEEFFTLISNRYSSNSEALTLLRKAQHNIKKAFEDRESLYDPRVFEDVLMQQVKKLSGLEKSLPNELGELIIHIIEKVDHAFDEGYLYDDYNDYNFEPPETFYSFVTNYARALSFRQKTEFLEELDEAVGQSSYSTFSGVYKTIGNVFDNEDLPHLKALLTSDYEVLSYGLTETYYQLVAGLLSPDERKKILSVLKDGNSLWLCELAELLIHEGRRKESIAVLEKWLAKNKDKLIEDEKVYFLYLDLLKAEDLDLRETARESIMRSPTRAMLEKIASLLPLEIAVYETQLEKKNAEGLLDYLEDSGRLQDALDLIKRNKNIWGDRVFGFYKKNKKHFPAEAVKYFSKTIDENLQHTGDHYYHAITDALQQLKKIDVNLADKLKTDIRLQYKRRSKLMSMISDI